MPLEVSSLYGREGNVSFLAANWGVLPFARRSSTAFYEGGVRGGFAVLRDRAYTCAHTPET